MKTVITIVIAFAAGALVRDVTQDKLNELADMRFREEIKKCERAGGHLTVSSANGMVCSAPPWVLSYPLGKKKREKKIQAPVPPTTAEQ